MVGDRWSFLFVPSSWLRTPIVQTKHLFRDRREIFDKPGHVAFAVDTLIVKMKRKWRSFMSMLARGSEASEASGKFFREFAKSKICGMMQISFSVQYSEVKNASLLILQRLYCLFYIFHPFINVYLDGWVVYYSLEVILFSGELSYQHFLQLYIHSFRPNVLK